MNENVANVICCPACHGALRSGRCQMQCEGCGIAYRVQSEVPIFLQEDVVAVASDHISNPIAADFEAILRKGNESILHIGAGATAEKYPNCIEFEHKIFKHTDVVGDAHYLPFRDASFDRVFAFNVFEHLREPARAAAEIARVLKPKGSVAIHTAFLQAVHEEPAHFYNTTEYGLREWFADFEIEKLSVSPNFSPGMMLAYLMSRVLTVLQESGVGWPEQTRVRKTTLGEWAEFWAGKTGGPAAFETLQKLPQSAQKKIAAGFELIGRKPIRGGPRLNQTSLLARQSADVGAESRASREEVVHHPAPDSNGFTFCLDEPEVWRTKSRWVRLSGWCLHSSRKPVTAIRARIGRKKFVTVPEISRPDIANPFGRTQENLRCGFSLEVRMPHGPRLLAVEAQTGGSPWKKVLVTTVRGPFLTRPGERRRRKERALAATTQRYRWWYDRPADWQKPTSILYISGWFIDTMGLPICGIRARVGRRFFRANVGLPRDDLSALYPNVPLSGRSGFAVAIPLPRRRSKIFLQYQGADGTWREFDSHRVRRGDRPAEVPPPSQMEFFTAPSASNPRFSSWVHVPNVKERRLRLSGWCFANEGPQVAAVRARAGRRITPGEFGIVRRDVALAHNNCTGSLHSGFLIHASIPRGRNQLVLEAKSTDGRWAAFFETTIRRSIFRRGGPPLGSEAEIYAHWIDRYERLTRSDKRAIKQHVGTLSRHPRFSILLPTYESDPRWLKGAIESVRQQFYSDWELCIADDASTKTAGWKVVQRYARADDRIKILRRETRGGIAAASNDALSLATGEFVALLDHDDAIARPALYWAAVEFERNPALQLIYTDEDKVDEHDQRHSPYFKPEWNPDLFLAQNYLSHLTFLRTDLVRRVGGFRSSFDGSQDYDLFLRCSAQIEADKIARIPRVLYHWRALPQSTAASTSAKEYAHIAALRAVQEHLDARNIQASVEPREFGIYQRVRYPLPSEHPLVSIIIPSRDQSPLLEKCIASILHKSDYANFEIIILENESVEEQTRELYRRLQQERRIRIIEAAGEFNFSRLINLGASHARGSIFLLLNNDVEIMNSDCFVELVSQVSRPEVGIVGARLWYPNGTLQHGGVILGVGGVASHIGNIRREDPGYFARQHLTQDFCAVTAACLMVRREVFESLGGFDESQLPVTFNDVDFCLRARELGWRIIYTPYAELTHHESVSRGVDNTTEKQRRFFNESEFLLKRWGPLIQNDPSYNPNLSLGEKRFELAFPPRVSPPWKKPVLGQPSP